MKFTWDSAAGRGLADLDGSTVTVTTPLPLPTPMTSVSYENGEGTYTDEEGEHKLPQKDIKVIEDYLQGLVDLFSPTPAETEPAVDESGRYIGERRKGSPRTVPIPPPAREGYRWNGEAWEDIEPLEKAKATALAAIDAAAGETRSRFITVVPGQESTYLAKAAEAALYLKDPTGRVGGFLAAEARATGLPVLEAAAVVAELTAAWGGVIGPRIEEIRRRGKLQVEGSLDRLQVDAVLQKTLAELREV